MFSHGTAVVPCTLLHFVGAELVYVAKGRTVQPGNRMFHGNPMPPTVYRVEVVQVLPGCDELLPPVRPAGADEEDEMTLSACVNWPLLWPKSQIRLGGGGHYPTDKTASHAGAKPWQERRNTTGPAGHPYVGHPYGTGSGQPYGTGSGQRRQ